MTFLRQNLLRASSLIATLAALAALGACRPGGDQPANADNATQEPAANVSSVPVREPALDRAGLLDAVAKAASATALGVGDAVEQRLVDGRQFEVRIRFGCRGPSDQLRNSWLGWAHDAEKNTLRLHAKPTISLDDAMVAAIGGEQVEAVEGFWIPRPWLLQAACPATVASPAAAQQGQGQDDRAAADATAARSDPAADQQQAEPLPAGSRVGIAQFFTAADPRTGRRGDRAYEAVKALKPDEPIPSGGFDLVLSGRLHALPGRKVISCISKSFDRPPDCLVSAKFDRVWIEQPETRETIAEWRAQ